MTTTTVETCKNGHERTPENTGTTNHGVRNCKPCRVMWGRQQHLKRKAGRAKNAERDRAARNLATWVSDATCGSIDGWHDMTPADQVTVCQGCPVIEQCAGLAAVNDATQVVYGGRWFNGDWATITHCPKGHPNTPENTYTVPDGTKAECWECRRDRDRKRTKQVPA